MIDVGDKPATRRRAVAHAHVAMPEHVRERIASGTLPKGDVLAAARIAGIMAAKHTPDIVPLCHPIALHGVSVELTLGVDSVEIVVATKTADRTGVEMEALTAVAAAGLALVDMVKAVDPSASIERVRVLRKEGGKTGTWERDRD